MFNSNTSYLQNLNDDFTIKDTYYSPELMKALKNKNLDIQNLLLKNDVFTLGMNILYMASLNNPFGIYDFSNFMIDYESLQQHIYSLNYLYSDNLISIIKIMLNEDPERRPDFVKLS